MKKSIKLLMVMLIIVGIVPIPKIFGLDGVYHNPTGNDELYGGSEVESDLCERYPRDPIAGQSVYIKSKTWPIEMGQSVWITWNKNSVTQPIVNSDWKYNTAADTHWEANLGSFSKGDVIEYYVHANRSGGNEKIEGPFRFIVTSWEDVGNVTNVSNYMNRVELSCATSGTLTPKISISFPEEDYFRLQLEATGGNDFATGISTYTLDDTNPNYIWINSNKIKIKIYKFPYRIEVYDSENNLLTRDIDNSQGSSFSFNTNGTDYVHEIKQNIHSPAEERFSGFGMKYDALDQRGKNVDIYTVNWYLDQGAKTYLPVPFYFSNKKYGTYLNTTYYVQYRLATDSANIATIKANTGGLINTNYDMYFFSGEPKEITRQYTNIVGKPDIPPVWAFGPWISANEWDKQSEVEEQLYKTNLYNIPTTATVIEAWSDEQTFYLWGDAGYTPRSGDWSPAVSDFNFAGKWPNPQAMINALHNNGIRVVLWQLPVIRRSDNPIPQLLTDESYAISNNYVLKDWGDVPYRNKSGWFKDALLPDFTNEEATDWYLDKRRYLIEEMGIDGFKCDGGEFVWGRNIISQDGTKGDELRNKYPDLYVQAYTDYVKDIDSDTAFFSRSGNAKAGKHPISWAGDQTSTFSAYRDAIRATMNASMSGVPFITWDLAGFSGEIPSVELYKRSTAEAAFSPIMQLHSEWSGDPNPSVARTPWNMYERTGDYSCITTYRKFANYRMSLIPYLYNQAKRTNATGIPLMRSMAYEYPNDNTAKDMEFQYMLGDSMVVAPIENEGQTNKLLYLPEGEWIDLFWGARRAGNCLINYQAQLDQIPVFVKNGSIIPLNLNENYEFGGDIGNSTGSYANLTFRIYPKGQVSYDYFDYVSGVQRQLTVNEDYDQSLIAIQIPAMTSSRSIQIYTTKPSEVKVNSSTISQYTDMNTFKNVTYGWYFDSSQNLLHIRMPDSTTSTSVIVEGISPAPYEAEFAVHQNVTVNNNHLGYTGTGFVDSFAEINDSVQFTVYAPVTGSYSIKVRYSAGQANGKRALYVNSNRITSIQLPKTTNWDTWAEVSQQVTLNAGNNQVMISYDTDSLSGINLDNIRVE